MNSDSPPLFWRRVGIVCAILAAGPMGGLFVIGVVRFLAFACGVTISDGGREALLAGSAMGAIVALAVAGALLSSEWDAP